MKTQSPVVLLMLLVATSAWAGEPQPPVLTGIQAAAERGEADGRFQLARAYLHGYGVPKNPAKSLELMRAAAEQGHADALGGVGYFYSNGITVEKSEKEAASWFRKGAENGSAKAQLNLAKLLLAAKASGLPDAVPARTPEELRAEGLQWLTKSADQGLADAALVYGSVLYFGEHGVSQDYGKAAHYLKIAAASGSAEARNTFGLMNQLGLGMEKDATAAESWFRKAALDGHLKAQSNLGRLLDPLANDKATRIEALGWLVIAAARGEVTAAKSLEDVVPGLREGELDEAKQKAVELGKLVRKRRPGA
jgi:TPR repeat protein